MKAKYAHLKQASLFETVLTFWETKLQKNTKYANFFYCDFV